MSSRGRVHVMSVQASFKDNLGPNLIWSASSATQWPGYGPLNMRCYRQGLRQLAGSPREHVACRSGNGTAHPPTQVAWPCKTSLWLAEQSPKTPFHWRKWLWSPENLNRSDRHGLPSAGPNRATLPNGKVGMVDFEVTSDWTLTGN